jgi:hypothetical protein
MKLDGMGLSLFKEFLMAKHMKWMLGAVLITGILVSLAACLNPIGFTPDFKLSLDANVTGELDTTDVTSAVIMISNRSKTVDVTKVTISHPEVPAEPIIRFENKPQSLKNKAQYVKPSDKEYIVEIQYVDRKDPANIVTGIGEVTISAPVPKETYWIYLYRTPNNIIIVDKEMEEPSDSNDTGNPGTDQNWQDGEGSSPAIIPPYNRDKMGAFIVMNMTKSQPVDNVKFEMGDRLYNIATVTFGHNTIPAVRAKDQQSIALGQGSWETHLKYTPTGGGAQVTIGPKQSIVIPINDPQAFRTNYLYFYKTKGGNYDVSHVWPPVPNDASDEDNTDIENQLDDNHGILQVINKSVTQTIVKGIEINTAVRMSSPDWLYPEQSQKFIVEAGMVNVRFLTDKSGGDYGQVNPVRVNARETKTLVYHDTLGQPDAYPPGSGLIKITNNSWSKVHTVKVFDADDPAKQLTIDRSDFNPAGVIGYGSIGRMLVEKLAGNTELATGKQYKIFVYLTTDLKGLPVMLEYGRVLKDTVANIVISQSDIELWEKVSGEVRIINQSNRVVQGTYVYNNAATFYGQMYSYQNFRPAVKIQGGSMGEFTVQSTQYMPLEPSARYNVNVYMEDQAGGNMIVIEKNGSYDLYNKSITITITQGDVDGVDYVPVYQILDVNNVFNKNNSLTINGRAVAQDAGRIPTAISNGKIIKWRVGTDGDTVASLSSSGLKVNGAAATAGTVYNNPITLTATGATTDGKPIKLYAVVEDGTAVGTPFEQQFNLTVVSTDPTHKYITNVSGAPLSMYVNDTFDLRSLTVTTARPAGTLDYATMSGFYTVTGNGSLSSGVITATGAGTITLQVAATGYGPASASDTYLQTITITAVNRPAAFIPVTDVTVDVSSFQVNSTTTVHWTVWPRNATNQTPVIIWGGAQLSSTDYRVQNFHDNGNGTGTVDIYIGPNIFAQNGGLTSMELNTAAAVKKGKGNTDISYLQYGSLVIQGLIPYEFASSPSGLGNPFTKFIKFTITR